ncbi:uncharacterized protein [Cicer arietinum]|uniref:uncharacterized protein n=1 Tax=Cicer arietinum TaxID=3827 RepID=UPI003CC57B67
MVRELETSLVTASPYSLILFPEIRNVDMESLIVEVGQVRVYEMNGVSTKFKGIELESDGIRIECALFGPYVDELDAYSQSGYNKNVVVLAQFIKVKMFNGKSQLQNAMNCIKFLFNPEILESISFKFKHSHNFDSPTQPLTHKKDTSHLSLEEELLSLFQCMTIEELKDCQNDMVCVVFGTVKHILGEGDWWYGACVPYTDSATFVIFDYDGISLTNKSCLNLLHEMDQDPQSDTVQKEIGDLVEKQLLFKIEIRQFPLSLCFAMTVNKSQSQSLSQVGLYLKRPVFIHGQFYVVISRVKFREELKIVILDEEGKPSSSLFRSSSSLSLLLPETRTTTRTCSSPRRWPFVKTQKVRISISHFRLSSELTFGVLFWSYVVSCGRRGRNRSVASLRGGPALRKTVLRRGLRLRP